MIFFFFIFAFTHLHCRTNHIDEGRYLLQFLHLAVHLSLATCVYWPHKLFIGAPAGSIDVVYALRASAVAIPPNAIIKKKNGSFLEFAKISGDNFSGIQGLVLRGRQCFTL